MRALYISQNGMLENLGQSQVLPYVRGLARRGVDFDLVSFELPDVLAPAVEELRESLARDRIRWHPLRRRRDPRLRVKVEESMRGVAAVLARAALRRPDIVHGRSYFATAIADVAATLMPRAKLLFDCRGMIGDEYVDAGHWTEDRVEYRLVKRYETRAFRRAEGVVVLTEALKRWIESKRWLGAGTRIEAIPCCVDLEKFRFDADARTRLRRELGLQDKLVLVYAGSLGTWYREPDVARFAGLVRRNVGPGGVAFLLLTAAKEDALVTLLRREGFGEGEVVVRSVPSSAMPSHLSAGDLGISFITSCFSKKGSSPTKVAEYLACGLPVVLNGDIGDQRDLARYDGACVVLDDFSANSLEQAAAEGTRLARTPLDARAAVGRHAAEKLFGLESVGVERYARLYTTLGSYSPGAQQRKP